MRFERGRVMALTPPPALRKAGARLLGGAGDDLTRPGALIEEAVTDLTRCGSAPDLYAANRSRDVPEQFVLDEGARNQTRFARDCILFSAIAAEAYVNAFFAESGVGGSDLDALDRLPIVEKYVVGVASAAGEVMFDRGSVPMRALGRLLSARDALVHPTPSDGQSVATPAAAGESLVAAASAAQPLIERAGAGELICELISANPDIFIEWGAQWTGALPPLDAPASVNLAAVAAKRSIQTEPRSGADRKP